MNHDPMCPIASTEAEIYWRPTCPYCAVIARVREDERARIYALSDRVKNSQYAAALRDAVQAVKLSCSADIELVERSEVIAAIEALGGER